jgi:alpha-mannosidase
LKESSPYRVTWKISRKWRLPAELTRSRKERSRKTVPVEIETDVTLWAGKKQIDFHTRVTNRAKEHRLRCGFSVPFTTDSCFAETKFDVIERKHLTREEILRQKKAGYQQLSLPTAPQDRFVSLCDGKVGVTFINRGLPEYEAGCKGKKSYYYLTLLRCTGAISYGDLLTRRLNAGPTIPSPGGQCLDTYDMFYSLTTHKRDWSRASVGRMAMEHNVPLFTAAYENRFRERKGRTLLPEKGSFLTITPNSSPVIVSAIKKAEERNSVIVRLINPSSRQEKVTVKTGKSFKKVHKVRLDEKRETTLTSKSGDSINLIIKPHKIFTLEIVFSQ